MLRFDVEGRVVIRKNLDQEQGIIKYAQFSCIFAQFSSIIFLKEVAQ